MKKQESETITKEHGVFQRIYHRKGKKRHQKTERKPKNLMKVTLVRLHNVELYVYPYDFPDVVFLGSYPHFTLEINKEDIKKFLIMYNRARWYFENHWQKNASKTKRAKRTSADISKAYNLGLNKLKKKKSPSSKHNSN